MNVGSHLTKRAILDPGLDALVDIGADVRYTFAELDERATRSAHVLAELALSKGDRVAVLLPNGHHFVEIFYRAARAGKRRSWYSTANTMPSSPTCSDGGRPTT
jgi:acyl-CoA synthetase (AMP-forming)/AMP-acid ligase II